MKRIYKPLLLVTFLLLAPAIFGQSPEMADTMRSEGKIYVVVAIILIVLAGLIGYLFLMDRKLSKMEKLISDKAKTK